MARFMRSFVDADWAEPSMDELTKLEKQLDDLYSTPQIDTQLPLIQSMSVPEDLTDFLPERALIDPSFSQSVRFQEFLPMLTDLINDPIRKNRAIREGYLTPESVAMIRAGVTPPNLRFHGTRATFGQFDNRYGDVGTHMGSRDQAADRLRQTEGEKPIGNEKIIPILTRAGNPLRTGDAGVWENANTVLYELSRNPRISDRLGRKLDELEADADELSANYPLPEEWIASDENRVLLSEIREALQEEGFDSIVYKNKAEGMQGAIRPDVADRRLKLNREQAKLERKYMEPKLEVPDVSGMTPEEADKAVQEWIAFERKQVPFEQWSSYDQKAYLRHRDELQQIENDPRSYTAEDSLIVFEPEDTRSPIADFMPEGMQDMSKPGLLRSAVGPTVGAGGIGALSLLSSPQEAYAAAQGDALRAGANVAEVAGRDIAGLLTGAVTGDRERRESIQSGRSVAPSEGIQALGNLVGQTVRGIAPAVSEGLSRAQEAAYDPVTSLLAFEPLYGGTIGEQIEAGADAFGQGWGWLSGQWDRLSPEVKERLYSTGMLGAMLPFGRIDPRYSPRYTPIGGPETRALEAGEYRAPSLEIEHRSDLLDVPEMSVRDLEGESFVTSLYDRTRGEGTITGIHDEPLITPIEMQGGNEFSLWHPGLVGASNRRPVTAVMNRAQEAREATGRDPLFLTFNMAPTGGDFSTMPGELMIARMQSTLSKGQMRALDEEIRNLTRTKGGKETFVGIKDWPGLENTEAALKAWEEAPGDVRKEVANKVLDKARGETGVSQTDARLLATAPARINAEDLSVQATVGRIDPSVNPPGTRHRSYPVGIPGRAIGRLPEGAFNLFDLFPELHSKQVPHRAAMSPMRGQFDDVLMDILVGNRK